MLPEGRLPRADRFRFDTMVASDLQIDNDRGYRAIPWDRGHLVRRKSLHWGDEQAAEEADRQSYFWTNIAPQHERLHDTAWGLIEDWVLDRAEPGQRRAAVFTGPIMTQDDPYLTNGPDQEPFQIPAGFWKVIVIPYQGDRTVASFLVWQRDQDSEAPISFSPFLEQVRLTTIEFLTGLSFGHLRYLDPQRFGTRTRTLDAQGRRSGPLNAVGTTEDIVL